jgi:hypothetical protein
LMRTSGVLPTSSVTSDAMCTRGLSR